MKTGRNDLCPCGSGKKYKKCCLSKDKEKADSQTQDVLLPPPSSAQSRPLPVTAGLPTSAHVSAAPYASDPELPPEPPNPEAEKWDARWKEFDSTDSDGRVAIFQETLEDGEEMTDDVAFEMLSRLHDDAVKCGERSRFAEWVGALRGRWPDVYKESAHYYLDWCLTDALAEGRLDVVPSLARELGAQAGRDLDTVHRTLDGLAYHGQLSALVEAMRVGWPSVKTSADIFPSGISDFANQGADYEIFDYLEHTTSPDAADPALLERVKYFVEDPRVEYLNEFIADLTGKSCQTWTVDDFNLKRPNKKGRHKGDDTGKKTPPPNNGVHNLSRLICEFVGYLRHEEGVAFPTGDLVRPELHRYFVERQKGDLKPKSSMIDQVFYANQKLPKPPPPIHSLCPERITLDVYLGRLVGMFNCLHHRAAALFQAIPAWLRFLESRRLIDGEIRRKTVEDLLPLRASILSIWEEFAEDPTLYRVARRWPEAAESGEEKGCGGSFSELVDVKRL